MANQVADMSDPRLASKAVADVLRVHEECSDWVWFEKVMAMQVAGI
jgi:hypothetical protein